MRSVNAITCLATLSAISSVSAGPFSWLHIRGEEASAPIAGAPITTNATSDIDASVTVDGKNVSVAQLYAYLNGTSALNVTSSLNATANATHSITFEAESEIDSEEEIELELTYSLEGDAVLSFLNGTQLCKGDEACREIVGEELGLTSEEVIEVEECADEIEEEEEEEDCDEEEDEYEDDEDEDCDDDEYEQGEATSSSSPAASSGPIANNWNVDSGADSVTSTAATRSHVYHVAAATNVASGSETLPTSTATSYMYVTSGAPAGATGTPFPSASGVSGQEQDDNTVTVTQYVTITVDRFIVGPDATTYLSTSAPAPTKGSNVNNNFAASSAAQAAPSSAGVTATRAASSPASTGSYYDSPDSPDTPDTPDTPDSPDSADDGYGNIEDCEEDEWEEIPEDDQEDDDEWECTEEEIDDGEDVIVDVSEYYNSTDCQAILSLNATDVNATYADLMTWCSNITSSEDPIAAPQASLPVNETTTTESFAWSSDAAPSMTASSTESWSSEETNASSTGSAYTESATESAWTETTSESASPEAITSYVDVYATEYVQPSASASSSADVAEATEGETLSRRLTNGFRRVRRSHVGRSAFV
ncbi:hypothetical protein NliqN6_6588 [Naganishia liquefaciens]|uniref:Uncharacterized protein n=1 Tax=Naganishia liquefaciens TaxID=104408 RepID=A0A8H3U092_9TREE|nr:hypothetical protein NliqN6_6588 [Naganishia liquefaciens]